MNERNNFPEPKELYNRIKSSAKKRGIPFDMTVYDFYLIDFPITCPILGIPLKWNRGKPKDNSYSFDRINSQEGYVLDNLEIISFRANRAKNNLTEEELKKIGLYYS